MKDGCCGSQSDAREVTWWRGRRIGSWGTGTRAASGIGLLVLALAFHHDHPWLGLPGAGSRGLGLLGGLLILPGLLTVAARVRGRSAAPLRADSHGVACALTLTVVVLWQIFPVAVFTFIGASLLLLAVRGDDGCEVLAIPNSLLGRRDYLLCLPFTPLDRWESGRRARSGHQSDERPAARPSAGVRIELLRAPGCPHAERARQEAQAALRQLRLPVEITERVGCYPSPTVLVDGLDVVTTKAWASGACCRLDRPTSPQIVAAIVAAQRS